MPRPSSRVSTYEPAPNDPAYPSRRPILNDAELLADGYVGFVATNKGECVGVMCGRTTEAVGFVPAHALAVASDLVDSTSAVVGLFARLAPVLLRDGASRFTIDHVDLGPLAAALNDAGFARGSVFASRPVGPTEAAANVDVRIGTPDDLDAIAALSLVEFAHRSNAPIYADPQSEPSPIAGPSTRSYSLKAPGHRPRARPSRPGVGARQRIRDGLGRLRLGEPAVPPLLARPGLRADGLPGAPQDRPELRTPLTAPCRGWQVASVVSRRVASGGGRRR